MSSTSTPSARMIPPTRASSRRVCDFDASWTSEQLSNTAERPTNLGIHGRYAKADDIVGYIVGPTVAAHAGMGTFGAVVHPLRASSAT